MYLYLIHLIEFAIGGFNSACAQTGKAVSDLADQFCRCLSVYIGPPLIAPAAITNIKASTLANNHKKRLALNAHLSPTKNGYCPFARPLISLEA